MNLHKKTITFLLFTLFITLFVHCALHPATTFALVAQTTGKTLLDALPQISDLPEGYQFEKREGEGFKDYSEQSSSTHSFITGRRNYSWTSKNGKSFTEYDFIRIASYANYRTDINDSYAEWSPEKFRANRLTWGEKGHSVKPYDGLPGGVIEEHIDTDSYGNLIVYIRINFWKSRECNGTIYIQYHVSNAFRNTQPSFEARAAEARAFCRPQIERLAKLIYSRLPEGTGSQDVAIDSTSTGSASKNDDLSAPEFTPAELAAASSVAGGAALVSALMLMGMSGVGREDIIQGIRDLLSGSKPVDSFDAWKQKYEALGWQYNVKDGVATFDPVDGCRNEEGLVWSSQKGAFVKPDAPVETPSVSAIPRDGDVNERGEVWSSLSGGYVDRTMYEQDLDSRAAINDAGRLRYDDNIYVREAREDFIEAKKAHFDSQVELVEKTAGLLSLNIEQLQEKESGSRFYTKDRDEFFRTTIDQAVKVMKKGKDLDKMTADLDAINDMIERQGRPTFEPQKTSRDKIEDGVMRGVATVADLALTKGGMNALVTGFQTARDGILTGMSEGEALTRGTIQGAVEAATAGVGHLAGKFGMNQAIVMAGTNAAIGTATSFRDQIAQGKDILSAVTRSLGDGAFAGATSYVTDKVTDMGLEKAQPYLDQATTYARTKLVRPFVDQTSPVLKIPTDFNPPAPVADLPADVAGKLNAARGGITTGPNGEKVLSIEDAKTLMRDSRTGRVMKPNPTEFSDVTEAHANAISTIKKSHDAATVSDFEKANPITDAQKAKGVVRRECKIEDFNTPGKKTTMSVDRDQRMVETLYDGDGKVISRREVPRGKWEGHSQKNFAEATNYNEADFRKTLSSGEQNAFDKMTEGEKLKLYQEKHGWKCTDKYHTEASIDNSDQIIDPQTAKRTTAGEPHILKVKRGEGTLQDAQGEGLMYVDKVRDAAASEQSVESFAQARKAVETYDGLRDGYASQNLETGTIKPGMRETMDVIKNNGDAAAQGNPEAIKTINDTLAKNGFRNMNDFADKIGGHIESLKWSKPKGG